MSEGPPEKTGGSELAAGAAASVGGGAALAAGAAGACCVPVLAPTLVALLGAGGAAWAAGLEPYSPYLLAVSAVLLAHSFWSLYGRGSRSSPRRRVRMARVVAWAAAVLWVAALGVTLFAV